MEKFKLLDIKITEKMAKEICTNISFYEFEKYTRAWYTEKNISSAVKIIFSIFMKKKRNIGGKLQHEIGYAGFLYATKSNQN